MKNRKLRNVRKQRGKIRQAKGGAR